jgi:hypothetical protein
MSINPLSTPQTPPATHHGHGHRKQVMDAAAKTLGLSADELQQDLSGGQTLDDVAKAKGMTHDQLVAGLSGALGQSDTSVAERLTARRWDQQRRDQETAAPSRDPLGSMVDVEA